MIEVRKEKYFWQITLNRPEVHNAFNPEMISKITETFRSADKEKELRYILLDAKGKSFSAGADLQWMQSMIAYSVEENQKDAEKLFDMFASIYHCLVPTIAKVQGNVFGGGLGLLAACDYVVADIETQFCFSEVKWGLSPATIAPFLLRKVNESFLKQFMLSAEKFSAETAYEIGLIHFAGEEEEFAAYLDDLCGQLYQNGPEAMRATKELLNTLGGKIENFRSQTAKLIAERRVSQEGQAGLNFFLTKEKPGWKPHE